MMKVSFLLLAMAVTPFLSYAQGLPEGTGKVLVETQCASCHGLEQVVQHKDTKDGWSSLVDYMVSRGMASTDEEVKTMVEYLAKSFPNEPKPAAGKGKSK
jgi:mono/diheme cytochrome c family protein